MSFMIASGDIDFDIGLIRGVFLGAAPAVRLALPHTWVGAVATDTLVDRPAAGAELQRSL
ncbi:MAG: hypothetical protein ACFCUT_16090 [Kiloniellaceae bacterium]